MFTICSLINIHRVSNSWPNSNSFILCIEIYECLHRKSLGEQTDGKSKHVNCTLDSFVKWAMSSPRSVTIISCLDCSVEIVISGHVVADVHNWQHSAKSLDDFGKEQESSCFASNSKTMFVSFKEIHTRVLLCTKRSIFLLNNVERIVNIESKPMRSYNDSKVYISLFDTWYFKYRRKVHQPSIRMIIKVTIYFHIMRWQV